MTFTPQYESRLLAVAPQPLRDVFLILMDMGMRPEEVYRMRWEDVRWEENVYHVPFGKTEAAERDIGMSERVRGILLQRQREQKASRKYRDSPWVFPSRRGRRNTDGHITTVNKAFAEARVKAKLPDGLVLYSTRHTFGTDLMQATGNVKLVMKSMGHIDVKTAMRYQHPETGQVGRFIDQRNAQRKSAATGKGDRAFGHSFGHSAYQPSVQNPVNF